MRVQNADGTSVFEFDIDRNSELAENLKGHLMLTTGDVDNVSRANRGLCKKLAGLIWTCMTERMLSTTIISATKLQPVDGAWCVLFVHGGHSSG